ncbi:MAG: hypothetical protein AAGC43_09115 [Bacteroidota bacterium]
MNRLAILYGCVLLSSSAIAEIQQGAWDIASAEVILESEGRFETMNIEVNEDSDTFYFDINEIQYIEEEEAELGFDTRDYLPEDFDPYTVYFNVNSIEYVEYEEDAQLGFDVAQYLPEGFDPYSQVVGVGTINYIEEEDVDLGFDSAGYLPQGFSRFEVYFDINSIIFIEIDELDEQAVMLPWCTQLENEPYN